MSISPTELARYLDFAQELADAGAAQVLPYFRSACEVENKEQGRFDPVTSADRAAERAMRVLIAECFPDDGILGEEEERVAGCSGRYWVLDPIDGSGLSSRGCRFGAFWLRSTMESVRDWA